MQAAVPIAATFAVPFFIRPDPDEDDFVRSSVYLQLSRRTHLAVDEVIDELVREGLLTRAERDGRAGVIVRHPAASGRCR